MWDAVMVEPGKIVFNEVEIPAISDNEVLIKVMRIGICGSDIHVYHGKHPYTSYPVIQGHEVSGQVIKVGGRVSKFKPGDKVVVQPQVVCGECYSCNHGDYHICDNLKVMGFQTEGWAREYYKVEERKVLKIPKDMSYEYGALVEPVAVACHALCRSETDLKSKKIIVLGAGTIGNLVAQVAKARGAIACMITDISDFRLDIARKCGIDYPVNVRNHNLKEVIDEKFGPNRADLILECIGNEATIKQAINNARKGSDIIIVGVFPEEVKVNMGYVQDRELRLIGTLMYKEEDFKEAISLLANAEVKGDLLITNHFNFKDYLKAYMYIEKQQDKAMKVMIDVAEE